MKKIFYLALDTKPILAIAALLFLSVTAIAQNKPLSLKDALNYALKNKADARKAAEGQISQAFIAAIASHRHWDRLNVDAVPA